VGVLRHPPTTVYEKMWKNILQPGIP